MVVVTAAAEDQDQYYNNNYNPDPHIVIFADTAQKSVRHTEVTSCLSFITYYSKQEKVCIMAQPASRQIMRGAAA
jgi:hypothetical protein